MSGNKLNKREILYAEVSTDKREKEKQGKTTRMNGRRGEKGGG